MTGITQHGDWTVRLPGGEPHGGGHYALQEAHAHASELAEQRPGEAITIVPPSYSVTRRPRPVRIGASTVVEQDGTRLAGERLYCGEQPVRSGQVAPDDADALRVQDCGSVTVERCTIGWGIDENLAVTGARDVVIRDCLNVHALQHSLHDGPAYQRVGHSCAAIVGYGAQRVRIERCLHAHSAVRGLCDVTDGGQPTTLEVANVVVYNWRWEVFKCSLTKGSKINIRNCLFVPGPDTELPPKTLGTRTLQTRGSHQVHVSGCRVLHPDGTMSDAAELLTDADRDALAPEPLETGAEPDELLPADEGLLEAVLASVGPADCDPYEAAIVEQVRQRTGRIIDSPGELFAGGSQ
ncbi:MAG: hypothetical protein ACLFV3_09120 [Phycisphaeraceae bacterium]